MLPRLDGAVRVQKKGEVTIGDHQCRLDLLYNCVQDLGGLQAVRLSL